MNRVTGNKKDKDQKNKRSCIDVLSRQTCKTALFLPAMCVCNGSHAVGAPATLKSIMGFPSLIDCWLRLAHRHINSSDSHCVIPHETSQKKTCDSAKRLLRPHGQWGAQLVSDACTWTKQICIHLKNSYMDEEPSLSIKVSMHKYTVTKFQVD